MSLHSPTPGRPAAPPAAPGVRGVSLPPVTDQFDRLAAALADRYALERELGAGGMATVYLARDLKHDRLVAIKVLHPDLAASLGTERFLREIQITAKLSHPHILPLYDSGEAGGFLYYVMPFVEGESLADRIAREQQLSIKEAVQLTREVAEALGYAHAYGLVHRDIKPQNIMLSGGHAIVADFGIATAVSQAGGEKLTRTGTTIGTPEYMSPEQAMGAEQLDGRSDLYSLACVLYEMLVGQVPFTGTTPQQIIARHSLDHVPPPSIVRDTIPEDLEEIILTAMAKVPADRYRTAADMVEALGAVDTGATIHRVARTATQPLPRRRRRRRRVWTLSGIGAAAVVLGGAAWVLLGGHHARGPAAGGGLDLKHIAVLDFDDLSPDSSLRPIADGLTEALIHQLAGVPALSVVSRNGVERWRGTDVPRDSVARALGSGTLVVGSVEPSGRSGLRVTTRLIDGASGADVGRRASFVVPRAAVLSAEDSLVRDVARTLRGWLGEEVEVRETRAGTTSVPAWTLLQQGEGLWRSGGQALAGGNAAAALGDALRADSLLAASSQADNAWSDPLVLRARVAYLQAEAVEQRPQRITLVQQGLSYAQRALNLSPGNGAAFEMRGTMRYALWRLQVLTDPAQQKALLDSAYADLQAAVRADPTLASAYATLSRLDHDREDLVESALAARAAYDADAYLRDAPDILSRLFFASYNLGQFPDAHRWCDEGARRFPADYRFALCELFVMTTPGAERDVATAWRLAHLTDSLAPAPALPINSRLAEILVGYVLRTTGLADSAEHVFARARSDDPRVDPEQDLPGYEAAMRALSGDPDGAMALLKRYVATHPGHSFQAGGILHWWWRSLESRPDFQAVVRARH
jgi:eukaryotic-like serine/threonine-protein kinase